MHQCSDLISRGLSLVCEEAEAPRVETPVSKQEPGTEPPVSTTTDTTSALKVSATNVLPVLPSIPEEKPVPKKPNSVLAEIFKRRMSCESGMYCVASYQMGCIILVQQKHH